MMMMIIESQSKKIMTRICQKKKKQTKKNRLSSKDLHDEIEKREREPHNLI